MFPFVVREDKTEEFLEKCKLSGVSKERREELINHAKEIRKSESFKNNNCKYCNGSTNDFIPLNDTADYSGVEIAFHHKGMLRARYEGGQDIVVLKVCPMCGKEINND